MLGRKSRGSVWEGPGCYWQLGSGVTGEGSRARLSRYAFTGPPSHWPLPQPAVVPYRHQRAILAHQGPSAVLWAFSQKG